MIRIFAFILFLGVLLIGCSSPSGSDNENSESESSDDESYTLTVNAEPSSGGDISIDPDIDEFEAGTEVEITVNLNTGWTFKEWTGDQESKDNPLVFTIEKDTELTAHFTQKAKKFKSTLTVSDGSNNLDLTFGMEESLTDGYDDGYDQKAPPIPPEGSFYAQFVSNQTALIKDFRAITVDEVQWRVEFAPEEGREISLNWDFNQKEHIGSLILTDNPNNPSFQLDMKSETKYEVTDSSIETLFIISN